MTEMSRNTYHCTWNNLNPQPLFHVPLYVQKVKHNKPQYFFTAELRTKKIPVLSSHTDTCCFHCFPIYYTNFVPKCKSIHSSFKYTYILRLLEIIKFKYKFAGFHGRCSSKDDIWTESNPDKGGSTLLQNETKKKTALLNSVRTHKTIIWNFVHLHRLNIREGFWC